MRRALGPVFCLLPLIACLGGCGPEIPAQDLGRVRFEIPAVPGAEKPYEMPELHAPGSAGVSPVNAASAGVPPTSQPQSPPRPTQVPQSNP